MEDIRRRTRLYTQVFIMVLLGSLVRILSADPVPIARISEATADNDLMRFSESVDVDGDLAVATSQTFNSFGGPNVNIHTYRRSDSRWQYERTIGHAYTNGGSSVAVSGTVISALGIVDGSTCLLLFESTPEGEWRQVASLPVAPASMYNMVSLAMYGDTVLVGVPLRSKSDLYGEVAVFERNGGMWSRTGTMVPAEPIETDYFGFAVDIDNGIAVVGAPAHPTDGQSTGAAYIFEKSASSWSQTGMVLPTERVDNMQFGSAVGVDGSTIVVGAPGDVYDATHSGTVFVYRRSGLAWAQLQRLVPSGTYASLFGKSVALRDGVLAGGMLEDDAPPPSRGVAAIFTLQGGTWIESGRALIDNTRSSGVEAATALALNGNELFVNAPYDMTDPAYPHGSLYVYSSTSGMWAQSDRLNLINPHIIDHLGTSAALSGDTVVLGTTEDVGNVFLAGSVHVHRVLAGGTEREAVLVSPHPRDFDYFGSMVSIDGDTLVTADDPDEFGSPRAPGLYVYRRVNETWMLIAELNPAEVDAADSFADLVIKGSTIVASLKTGRFSDYGALYVFREIQGKWLQTQTITAPAGHSCIGPDFDLDRGNLLVNVGYSGVTVSRSAWYMNVGGVFSLSGFIDTVGGAAGPGVDLDNNRAVFRHGADLQIFQRTGDSWTYAARIRDVSASAFAMDDDVLIARTNYLWQSYREVAGNWIPDGVLALDSQIDATGDSIALQSPLVILATPFDSTAAFEAGSATLFDVGAPPHSLLLSVDATCPEGGGARAEWANATPGGTVALIAAQAPGSFIIPPGNACAGVSLGLSGIGLRIVYSGPAGAQGARTIRGNAPSSWCDDYVQLLDAETCGVSNVVQVR